MHWDIAGNWNRLIIPAWLVLFSVCSLHLHAQQVSADDARNIARVWIESQATQLKSSYTVDSVIHKSGAENIHVVKLSPRGFVIIPAIETAAPIWGYSTITELPGNPDHPLYTFLLPAFQTQVTDHRSQITVHDSPLTVPDSRFPIPVSQTKSLKTDLEILPILTAKWGQGNPWNQYCPAYEGQHALVGCVAVAMSQIMYKWQWPDKGRGSNSYRPPDHPEYGQVSANFDTTYYQWDQMHSMEATEASSLILYHAGVATNMNYGPYESGSTTSVYAIPALINNFSYQSEIHFETLEQHSYTDWIRMLRQELINDRPVLYTGTNPENNTGHAFNIDGFRSGDYFHFNWGWNGAGNGYFLLYGMAGGGGDFSKNQGAMFGIQPTHIPLHDRPTTLQAMPGDGFIELLWDHPSVSNLSHYVVYRNEVAIANTPDTHYRDNNLSNETAYQYHVTAVYVGQHPGESQPTPNLTVTPWERIIPTYTMDFETETNGWQFDQNTNGFQVGPASTNMIGGNSGNLAFIRSEGMGRTVRVSDYLISPVIYPSDYQNLAISFDYLFKQKTDTDILHLMYRKFSDGLWKSIVQLDSTGGWSDWLTYHIYIPEEAHDGPIQIGFYYNNFYREGYGAAIDNISFYENPNPPTPEFSASLIDLCQDQIVWFTDESSGNIFNYLWDFGPHAEPRYANTAGPHRVVFDTPGEKDITLSLNHLDHLTKASYLTIRAKPQSGFTYERTGMQIQFSSTAQNAEIMFWDLGDGTLTTEINPTHTYYTKEIFEVKQISYNGLCDPDTLVFDLDLRPGTGIDDAFSFHQVTVFPNPGTGQFTLQWNEVPMNNVEIRISTLQGRLLKSLKPVSARNMSINIEEYPNGLYILQIIENDRMEFHRIMKCNLD